MRFIGRTNELDHLNQQYQSSSFEFTVIYGRRRIGKTRLIEEYIKDKNAIYFMALQSGERLNLDNLSAVYHQSRGHSEFMPPFASFRDLFSDLAEAASKQRIILVIDEYPYLAEGYHEISSIIQEFCDHQWKNTKLHLILCGSAMSFMERQVLGAKSPLYGRRTSQIKLFPFRFTETEEYLHVMSRHDRAVLHAVTGGVAEYLSFVNPKETLEQNIISLFLNPNGRLIEEPANLLMQELRDPKNYNNILDAVAGGASKHNEISTKTGIASGALTNYLTALINLGIMKRETPFSERSPRKTIYRISDGCFRFWYRYVSKHRSAIELGLGKQIYRNSIAGDLNSFMGYGFEQIAYDLFDELNRKEKLPAVMSGRGRWWGNNPIEKREEEIDLYATSEKLNIFGEIKWTNEKTDLAILKSLITKSHVVDPNKSAHYLLFSKSGFTKALTDHAVEHRNVELIQFLE